MKSKIGVEIHKQASENENLLRVVANNNDLGLNVTMGQIMGYLDTRKAMYPTISKYLYKQQDNEIHISEDDGKTFSLSLTWKEVEELKETEQDIPPGLFEKPGNEETIL